MLKTVLIGKVISENADTFVMDEGDGIATYSKRFYRLPFDRSGEVESDIVPWISEACNADVNATERWLLPHLTLGDAVDSYAAYKRAIALVSL
ncbi:hypothetical protein [Cohnella cholangitidis]|uniref:Uncharacterized protein n=1 Tax=Cohnella cholangitidis TaxID=2598458 RepID=A0A7G5C5F6_9BACL|nr:hypothetical protein [Cohnella cholangitidis]QMV44440.1 hypothetical protein FPL14_27180 [Cohnella cholangitidis]